MRVLRTSCYITLAVWLLLLSQLPTVAQEPATGSAKNRRESNEAESPNAERLPNIVVIFIDDLGYADIGAFGATKYKTPHLDQMATQGRKFTDFVAATAVCSASRAALLTGCYPPRVGINGALDPRNSHGIAASEMTLAELCKQQDYATGCFGKWHLGHHEQFLPLQHGFDEFYGLPYSNDMWPLHPSFANLPEDSPIKKKGYPDLPCFDGNEIVDAEVTEEDQALLTRQYTQRSVAFIETNKDRPFFLYVPHSMVHVPLYVSDDFKGKSGAGLFADVMMEIDWSVGQILGALKKHDLENNTLVVFTSDNGPWLSYGDHAGSALPLREGKGTMWEGGYRAPTIMWWPGKIPANSRCDEFCSTIDLLPTVAQLIGGELPEHTIDGKDIRDLMFGVADATSPHEYFYLYYNGQLQGIRDRRWKLHFPHGYRTLAGRRGGSGGTPANYEHKKTGLELYDLHNDVAETNNVAAEHPDIVKRLEQIGEQARADLGDTLKNVKGSGQRPPDRVEESQTAPSG